MTTKTRPGRLSEVVADRIESEILVTGLGPGDHLPTEPQLVEQHDVSRTVIREAARILEQRGLVDIRPGRGMIVTHPGTIPIVRQYTLLLRMSPAAFHQLMDVRELVEVQLSGLAAENHTEDDLEGLALTIDTMAEKRDDFEVLLREDLRFHSLVAAASGNELMSLLVDPINECLRASYQVPSEYTDRLEHTIREHQAILDAIRAGDALAAREATRSHLERVRNDPGDLFGRTV